MDEDGFSTAKRALKHGASSSRARRLPSDIADLVGEAVDDGPIGPAESAATIELARSLSTERFPDAVCSLLSGSYARGAPRLWSDVDIYVFLAGGNEQRQQIVESGKRFQIQVLDLTRSLATIRNEAQSGSNKLSRPVVESVLLSGSKSIYRVLRGQAEIAIAGSKVKRSTGEIERLRLAVVNGLVKTERSRGSVDALNDIVRLLISGSEYAAAIEGMPNRDQASCLRSFSRRIMQHSAFPDVATIHDVLDAIADHVWSYTEIHGPIIWQTPNDRSLPAYS